jgi:phosphoribosylformylglycinamidine synthase
MRAARRAPGARLTPKRRRSLVRAKVYVTPKPGVLDPAGKAIERALHSLGFGEAHDVRLGKYIEMRIDGDSDDVTGQLDEMCRKLLANGIIEDYRFEVGD